MNIRPTSIAAAAALVLLAGGCLERKETITIHADGSADLRAVFSGDEPDMTSGDALPLPGGPWSVEERRTKKSGGEGVDLERTATLRVGAGGALPGSYAAGGDDGVSLAFPTSVTMEKRSDGQYLHFVRTYKGRADAPFTLAKRELQRDPRMSKLLEADPDSLGPEDRRALLDAFLDIELSKELRFVDAGAKALAGPQDVGLRIRQAVLDARQAFPMQRALDLLAVPQTEDRDHAIAALAAETHDRIASAITDALAREGLSPGEVAAFRKAEAHARRSREITEDLGDERWEVRVQLPGEVVGHNATREADGTLLWVFSGESLMDADVELRATCRVSVAK